MEGFFSVFQSCSFYNSNAVPLKLSFQNLDPQGDNINVIFKVSLDAPAHQVRPHLVPLYELTSGPWFSQGTICVRTC